MQITTDHANVYTIGEKIASGAQGRIYTCSQSDKLIKICKESDMKAIRRLAHEVQGLEDIAHFFTFPKEIITGEYVGYVMDLQRESVLLEREFSQADEASSWEKWNQDRDLKCRLLIGYHIARAISALHNARMLYRDLSPRNIMVSKEKTNTFIRIIDVDNISPETNETGVLGTRRYLAPEIYRTRKPIHTRYTDVYALAVILFKFFLGKGHPLIGDIISQGGLNQEEAAYRGERGYVLDDPKRLSISKENEKKMNALADALLTPKLKELFHRTFVEGLNAPRNRPGAAEFAEACYDAANAAYICPECGNGYILHPQQQPLDGIVGNNPENSNYKIEISPVRCPYCSKGLSKLMLVMGDFVYPRLKIRDKKAATYLSRKVIHSFPLQKDIVLAKKYIKPMPFTSKFNEHIVLKVQGNTVRLNTVNEKLYFFEEKEWKEIKGGDELPKNRNLYFMKYECKTEQDKQKPERFIRLIEG